MARCGGFSHELLESGGIGGLNKVKLVRCTIVALNPRENTVDVEFGTNPPQNYQYPELVDIDCPDIPMFDGDGWSEDEQRRRFNSVPIYYHCQGSKGTVNELRTGHMAFRAPPIELESPPYIPDSVADRHEEILREKVLLLYIPPTVAEIQANPAAKGYRYVIGHTDRNDISPCRSEYICVRLNGLWETSFTDPLVGHSDASKTVVAIIDPIGQRKYKGLEQYGISFPCLASDILDKVISITIDENTPLEDIAFLDDLYAIGALYDNAFIYGAYSHFTVSYQDVDCHEWYPEKLCWLTKFFDYGLQCEDKIDRSQLLMNYYQSWILHHNYDVDNLPFFVSLSGGPYTLEQWAYVREFMSYDYAYRLVDFPEEITGNTNSLLEASYSGVEWEESCGGLFPERRYRYSFENWIIDNNDYEPDVKWCGFYSGNTERIAATFSTATGFWEFVGCGPTLTHSYTIKTYVPWRTDPFYEFECNVTKISGIADNSLPIKAGINDTAMIIGRQACYGLAFIAYDSEHIKAEFAYNPYSWLGSYASSDIYYSWHLEGVSEYLTSVFSEMFAMYSGFRGYVSAFVIDVVE